jgi:hypothetical protein
MINRSILRTLCLLLVIVMAAPMLGAQVSSAKKAPMETTTTYNLYFGDLHAHSVLSDGIGEPEAAFEMAREGGADFQALTEHVQWWHAYDAWVMKEDEWVRLKEAAEAATTEDFVAIAGYETWMLANCGEVNVYNVSELPAYFKYEPLGYRYDRLPIFYDWLAEQEGAVGQFNHPLYVSEDFMNYTYYSEWRDMNMGAIEAYNWEYYDESYQKALDAGWHLMPTANTDTHAGDWIVAHEMRSVLLAKELTHDALYDAMRNQRGYATLDQNLRIEYTLDGAVMGENLSAADGEYTAWIKISDPDGIQDEITLVEIVYDDGEIAASIPMSGDPTEAVELNVELQVEDARYFYVRVTTVSPLNLDAEGITAWTSPVWTGL